MGKVTELGDRRRKDRKPDGAVPDGHYPCIRAGDERLDWSGLRGHNGYLDEATNPENGERQLIFIPDDDSLPIIVIGYRPPQDN